MTREQLKERAQAAYAARRLCTKAKTGRIYVGKAAGC